MEEAAEPVVAADAGEVGLAEFRERAQGSGLCQCAVWAMVVEVALVLGHDRDCVALVDDEDPIEEFAADAAHEPLGDGVRAAVESVS